MTGFKVASARGTGRCTCAEPFFGPGCEQGLCPPGQRLDRHALGVERSEKYQQWQLCAPCQAGRFKNSSGNEECSLCPAGQVPVNGTHCLPCSSGTVPSPDVPETCVPCAAGDVALTGAATCTPCPAGTAPDGERSACVACEAGAFARRGSGPGGWKVRHGQHGSGTPPVLFLEKMRNNVYESESIMLLFFGVGKVYDTV